LQPDGRAGRQRLFDTIRAAANGETLLSPEILQRVLNYTAVPPTQPTEAAETILTERELEVLTAVAQGDTSKAIAAQLGVTERTIKAHLTNIYNKLSVDSRAAAVATGIQQGLIT
jgi:NarL family two-component system response regulator YdfI